MEIRFAVDGKPLGKGRPRFASRGGFTRAYTPKKTLDYEQRIRDAFLASPDAFESPSGHPVWVNILARFSPPKSASKRDRQSMLNKLTPYTKKPDLDNIAKAVCDALNNVAYLDDSQIIHMSISKSYGEEECLFVCIGEFADV